MMSSLPECYLLKQLLTIKKKVYVKKLTWMSKRRLLVTLYTVPCDATPQATVKKD